MLVERRFALYLNLSHIYTRQDTMFFEEGQPPSVFHHHAKINMQRECSMTWTQIGIISNNAREDRKKKDHNQGYVVR